MKKVAFIILFICNGVVLAQTGYNCPGNTAHINNDSDETLSTILTSDEYDSIRSNNNISSLKYYTPSLLTSSSYSCNRLNNFVNSYLSQNTNESYNYFKVGSYYFIVTWHPSNSTGYKNTFFFDSQYNFKKVWGL